MIDRRRVVAGGMALPLLTGSGQMIDIRRFGAKGDGRALDHDAINRAIDAAALTGEPVMIPAGRYRCFSIRLRSRVTLMLAEGAVIEAAVPGEGGRYDSPEATPHGP